jgi:phage I-like protein
MRTVQVDAERGARIDDRALNLVEGTALNTGRYLDQLKGLGKEGQIAKVKADLSALKAAANKKVARAVNAKSKIDGDVKARAAKEVAEILAEYVPGEWWDAVKANLYAAGAQNIAHEFTNITGSSVIDRSAA